LLAASFVSAIALFYALDTGVYLTLAFYAALILIYSLNTTRVKVYRGPKDVGFACALGLIPPLGALSLLRLTQGPAVFIHQFWQNMTGYIHEMLWRAPVPFWECLRVHEEWLFIMGLWLLGVYAFTLLFVGGLIFLRKISPENISSWSYRFTRWDYLITTLTGLNQVVFIPVLFLMCSFFVFGCRYCSSVGHQQHAKNLSVFFRGMLILPVDDSFDHCLSQCV